MPWHASESSCSTCTSSHTLHRCKSLHGDDLKDGKNDECLKLQHFHVCLGPFSKRSGHFPLCSTVDVARQSFSVDRNGSEKIQMLHILIITYPGFRTAFNVWARFDNFSLASSTFFIYFLSVLILHSGPLGGCSQCRPFQGAAKAELSADKSHLNADIMV